MNDISGIAENIRANYENIQPLWKLTSCTRYVSNNNNNNNSNNNPKARRELTKD